MQVELIAGHAACARVSELLRGASHDIVGMAIEPGAGRHRACELLALAHGDRALVVDVPQSPGLGAILAEAGAVAAVDSKRHAHALLITCQNAPARFADPLLAEKLLQGGRPLDLTPAAIAREHGVSAPPDMQSGLDGLAEFARFSRTLILAQGAALKRVRMGEVSRIEAQATVPIARIEQHGLPFRAQIWRAVVAREQKEQHRIAKQIAEQLDAKASLSGLIEAPNGPEEAWLLGALQARLPGAKAVDASTLAPLPLMLREQISLFLGGLRRLRASGARFAEHARADGRIAATFEQIGASTGRMACTAPNLQGVPGDPVRRACFAPDETRILIMGDYQACELRILASMSEDPTLLSAFSNGEDVHTRVAREVFGKALGGDDLLRARQRAKALSFGLIYGMSATGLARQVDCSRTEADALIASFFRTLPKVQQFLIDGAQGAIKRGYATSIAGRRLYLESGISGAEDHARLQRLARNMPIQASSADITKAALGALEKVVRKDREVWLTHCVHDEIVLECPRDRAEELSGLLRKCMSSAAGPLVQNVQMTVDVVARNHWTHGD